MNEDKHNQPLKQHDHASADPKPAKAISEQNAVTIGHSAMLVEEPKPAQAVSKLNLFAFQAALQEWLAGLEKELPAPSQQSALSYIEANFERLSLDLHQKVTEAQNAV